MADNFGDPNKRRLSGSSDEETLTSRVDKKSRMDQLNENKAPTLASSSQLVQSLNLEWSSKMGTFF